MNGDGGTRKTELEYNIHCQYYCCCCYCCMLYFLVHLSWSKHLVHFPYTKFVTHFSCEFRIDGSSKYHYISSGVLQFAIYVDVDSGRILCYIDKKCLVSCLNLTIHPMNLREHYCRLHWFCVMSNAKRLNFDYCFRACCKYISISKNT